jgi:hypothetical protein
VVKPIIVTDSCFYLPHAVATQNDDFEVVLRIDSNKLNEEKRNYMWGMNLTFMIQL